MNPAVSFANTENPITIATNARNADVVAAWAAQHIKTAGHLLLPAAPPTSKPAFCPAAVRLVIKPVSASIMPPQGVVLTIDQTKRQTMSCHSTYEVGLRILEPQNADMARVNTGWLGFWI